MNFIISDIHGCIYTLEKLIEKIKIIDENSTYIFNGDFVDRGMHSKQVIDFLINMKIENCTFLRGNHDDIVDYLLNGRCYTIIKEMIYGPVSDISVFKWWMQNGLATCLKSYGVDLSAYTMGEALLAFCENVPENHKKFFNNLEMFWENKSHFCCHAWYDPNKELPRDIARFTKTEEYHQCLWGRFRKSYATKGLGDVSCKWDKIGVFGHTPVSYYDSVAPIKHDKIRLIDTGSFFGEYLCAYCVDTDDHILQSVDSRDLDKKYIK